MSSSCHYVVLGGGIAGVTCVETLSFMDPEAKITLVSASPLIKTVTNYVQLTQIAEIFDVEEKPLSEVERHSNVRVVQSAVEGIDVLNKCVNTSRGQTVQYDKLCICTGGKPKVIAPGHPLVVGIRDTESVKNFQEKIKSVRRVVIVGNGGIATELVYELEGMEVVWAIRDKAITHTFVDAGASTFFTEWLNKDKDRGPQGPDKRLKYTVRDSDSIPSGSQHVPGGALGPDWSSGVDWQGQGGTSHSVHVEHEVEVRRILSPDDLELARDGDGKGLVVSTPPGFSESPDWPVYVELTNGQVIGCDLVVSATGVTPATDMLPKDTFNLALDGGVKVNDKMETSVCSVFAAGDVCTACWEMSPQWQQMRLWSQARQMGCYAAKCMVASHNDELVHMDFCFELFAHVTNFFRFKVVLLGKFNAQGLDNDYEILLRVTKGEEYIKVILHHGRMVGAILIGDTDMEETFENLILNAIDLEPFKDNLLEPGIDIDDFFD